MHMVLKSFTLAFLAVISISHGAAFAQDAKIRAGTLTCKGQGSVGLILGSKENLTCDYTTTDGNLVQRYAATITRIGLDIGQRGKNTMIWTVLGTTTNLQGEELVGNFAGVSADVAAGIGAGANILVGGNSKSVVLQPLSVSGGSGFNIAVGVSGLKLQPMATLE